MAAFGSWQLAGAEPVFSSIVGVVKTVEDTLHAKAFDADEGAGTWGDLGVTSARPNFAANFQLFPNVPAATDAVAFGALIPFCEIEYTESTSAVYDEAAVLAWEYSTGVGTWGTLTLTRDSSDLDSADGTRAFQSDGFLSFIPPADWASVAVGGTTAYWIRAVVQADKGDNITTVPIASTNHSIVSPENGFTCPAAGSVTGIRTVDAIAEGSVHTGSSVKFILVNFTTGDHTALANGTPQEWRVEERQTAWSAADANMSALAVNRGDELGVLITQEDSGNDDPTNVMLELQVSV